MSKTPVKKIRIGKAYITVLGTAHVSQQSVYDLERLFKQIQPHVLAVELCNSRAHTIKNRRRWQNLDVSQIIRERKFWLVFASLILNAFQKKIGKNLGAEVGAEMKRAFALAQQSKQTRVALIDREISITLKRAWASISLWSKFRLFSEMFASWLIHDKTMTAAEIENLKKEDVLSELIRSIPKRALGLKAAILSERDLYMAEKLYLIALQSQKPTKILAVVGAAHMSGIVQHLQNKHKSLSKKTKISELEKIPKKTFWKRIWLPFSGILMIVLSAYLFQPSVDWKVIRKLIFYWILLRSIPTGFAALITRGHIITIITTMIFAPISYFLGFVGFRLWMISAFVQVKLRKPLVSDFERIADDFASTKSFFMALYHNKVLNLLWLIWLVSFALTIGNLMFIYYFAKTLT